MAEFTYTSKSGNKKVFSSRCECARMLLRTGMARQAIANAVGMTYQTVQRVIDNDEKKGISYKKVPNMRLKKATVKKANHKALKAIADKPADISPEPAVV